MGTDYHFRAHADPAEELPTIGFPDAADSGSGEILPPAFWAQCLAIGEMVPEFALPDVRGELVSLEELLDAGPVVLTFQHDPTCACCEPQRRLLVEAESDIVTAGGSLTTIFAAPFDLDPGMKDSWSERLYDPSGRVARLFGLLCQAPTSLHGLLRHSGMALPDSGPSGGCVVQARAIYVIDGHGVVAYAAVSLGHAQTADANVLTATLIGLQEPTEAVDQAQRS
jgi:peroxiredoxin